MFVKVFQNAKHKLFLFHKKIVESENGRVTSIFLSFLLLVSFFWKVIAAIRWQLFNLKPFRPFVAKAMVVSVGNIVAGGSGKTPLVIKLINELHSNLDEIGVLSRGYGANQRNIPQKISKDVDWKLIGDEPKCILNNFNRIDLYIGKDRRKNALRAISDGKKLLILDDGLQQKKLHCDIQIIMLNANDLFGGGFFLPRGFLKDHPKRLDQADLIVINHCSTKKDFEELKIKVNDYARCPIVGANFLFKRAEDINKKKFLLDGQRIGVFCSIANPNHFAKSLKDLNYNVVLSKFFNDHEAISPKSIFAFEKECSERGVKYLVCTEKDFVKVGYLKTKIPIVVVKIEINICFEKQLWDNLVEKIHFCVNNSRVTPTEIFNEKLV